MNINRATNDSVLSPHANQRVFTAGPTPEAALGVLILLHGRGDSAENILSLHKAIGIDELAAIAPQAAGNTWYPNSFLAPLASNQPHLDSALAKIDSVVSDLLQSGVASRRIALLGFSQGACLTCEFAARHPRHYGAVMALTGGLIGPLGTAWKYAGSLANTPVFLGSNDPDPHVPFTRVQETQTVLKHMDATVELRRYPGMPHSINKDELDVCRQMLQRMLRHAS